MLIMVSGVDQRHGLRVTMEVYLLKTDSKLEN